MPGLNKLDYKGEYWPDNIISVDDEKILEWIESHLYLITLEPREWNYDVLENTKIDEANAKALADAAEQCWTNILSTNLVGFGTAFRKSFEAQIKMFPNMVDEGIMNIIERYKNKALGWKLSGAGGGGYLILVSDKPIEGAMQIKIRRATQL